MEALKHIWKKMALAALILAGMGYSVDVQAAASKKNVMCVKTNTGHYFPVVRVSMMVVADGASTFEIVLKDGEGEANVESISFEKHEEMIDFELYRLNSDGHSVHRHDEALVANNQYGKVLQDYGCHQHACQRR